MKSLFTCFSVTTVFLVVTFAQQDARPQGQNRSPRPDLRGPPDRTELIKEFDKDGDGQLNGTERTALRESLQSRFPGGSAGRQGGRPGGGSGFFGGPGRQGGPPGFGGRGGGRGGRRQAMKLVGKFDQDKDGKLDAGERAKAREFVKEQRASGQGGRGGFRGGGGRGRGRGEETPPEPGVQVELADVKQYSREGLYDESVLRTLFLQFEDEDWLDQLSDFYRTDVEVPAGLTVDGKSYSDIGVRIRGNTSSSTVSPLRKRSLNISVDYHDDKQRLGGYKTLNLLNAHADPTFLREFLFDRIARQYIPAARANFVRVVINGESWGIYVNAQQFNKDFLREWFGTSKGVRWKMPANPRQAGGFGYEGDNLEAYKSKYQLKTDTDDEPAFKDLVSLFKVLNETASDQLENALNPIFNLDRALWFMALENVLIDNDGYWTRASDFSFYQDKEGRFHMIPHDNNETFRYPGGPTYSGTAKGTDLDPLYGQDQENKPVMNKLMAVPALKARYLAHVRTIAEESLDWNRLQPVVEKARDVIRDDVLSDTRKLDSNEDFLNGVTEDIGSGGGFGGGRGRVTPGLKPFIEKRRQYLLSYSAIDKPTPLIESISHRGIQSGNINGNPFSDEDVRITAEVDESVKPDSVILYYSEKKEAAFSSKQMNRSGKGRYQVELDSMPAGSEIFYYVEARAIKDHGTTSFLPSGAEFGALSFRYVPPIAESSPIVINEIMAINESTHRDPQGEFDDWIELVNLSDQRVDISGMYLSDNKNNPRKWRFPGNTALNPGGYLIVWADNSSNAEFGLHANFKLSGKGETVFVFDRDEAGNGLLDSVEFGLQEKDQSFRRFPDGKGSFSKGRPSPDRGNN